MCKPVMLIMKYQLLLIRVLFPYLQLKTPQLSKQKAHFSVEGGKAQVISDCFVGGFFTESLLIQSKTKSNLFPSKGTLTVFCKFVGININQACPVKRNHKLASHV